MKIIPLSEGAFTIDQTKVFIPFDINKDKLNERSRGSLLVEIQPFLVITGSDFILLDTGLGFTDESGFMQIHKLLRNQGVDPSQITKVLLSHLHKDHSGGMMMPGKKLPAFENAKYYISRQEFDLALKGSPSYLPEDFKELKNIEFTEGNGRISEEIEFFFTGAHSPYHQVFKITTEGRIIFFGGDVAPQLQQMKNRFKAKYDYQPEAAMLLRQEWWKKGEEERWTFLFYHDIKCPMFEFKM